VSLANDTPDDAKTEVDEDMDFDPGDLLVKAIAGLGSLTLSDRVWTDPQRRLSVQ
jgi:hypothetical protein